MLSAVCKVNRSSGLFSTFISSKFFCTSLQTNRSRPVSPEEPEMQPKQNIADLSGGERDWDFAALVSTVKFPFRIEEGRCSRKEQAKGRRW